MRTRSAVELAEDPRLLTLGILALSTVMLWLAAASQMGLEDLGAICAAFLDRTLPGTSGSTEIAAPGWDLATVAGTVGMWICMMAAMMLPAMAPVAAVYATLAAKEDRGARLVLRVTLFLGGYFLLWAVFSVGLALVQLGLRDSLHGSLTGDRVTPLIATFLLLAAGAYQLTPLKEACMTRCRQPMTFLMMHWRDGLGGAFPLGLRHGLNCLGCCAVLMGLMFVFGAMNLWWMALIALYCLAEKIAPRAETWGRIAGVLLLAAGGGMALATLT